MSGLPEFVLVNDRGKEERLEPRAFASIPLQRRVRLILERRVTFWIGNTEIDPRTALAAMRRAAAGEPEAQPAAPSVPPLKHWMPR